MAKVFDKDGKPFGRHFAGPSSDANDGSRVTSKAVASASLDPIPLPGSWLLVNIISHDGSGVLSPATSIQRLNTKVGKAPAPGCDASHVGREIRVPYSADYLFYAARYRWIAALVEAVGRRLWFRTLWPTRFCSIRLRLRLGPTTEGF